MFRYTRRGRLGTTGCLWGWVLGSRYKLGNTVETVICESSRNLNEKVTYGRELLNTVPIEWPIKKICSTSHHYQNREKSSHVSKQNKSTEGCSKIKGPLASPKVGQNQVSRWVSVLCWHAAHVSNVLWKARN